MIADTVEHIHVIKRGRHKSDTEVLYGELLPSMPAAGVVTALESGRRENSTVCTLKKHSKNNNDDTITTLIH